MLESCKLAQLDFWALCPLLARPRRLIQGRAREEIASSFVYTGCPNQVAKRH